MSKIVHVDIDIDNRDILETSLNETDVEWEQQSDTQIQVTQIDGRPTNRISIDLKEGRISHDSDYRGHRQFAKRLRQLYNKNKAINQCILKGHEIENQWVSDGVETHPSLAEAREGTHIIAASCN